MATDHVPNLKSSLDDASIRNFRAMISGTLLLPGGSLYEDARQVWNGMIDRSPAAIAQCTGPHDVALAISIAKEHGLPITVKGGGHGVAGKAVCDGGLMIDCSPMQSIEIDPVRRIARAGGGVTWGAFDTATQQHGLATTGGVVASTGIAGLTLGGGIGFLVRKCGHTCDNLVSAEVVIASGEAITANGTEHPDLFWALRGGGGNFGVVTSFSYRLHEIDQVLGGVISYPLSDALPAIKHYRDITTAASDEHKVDLGLGTGPDGQPAVNLVVCHCGDRERAETDVQNLRQRAQPTADTVAWTTYLEMQMLFAETFPHGSLNYWKSSFLAELSDPAIETMIARFSVAPTPHVSIILEQLGGAASRIDPGATAFGERSADYDLIVVGCWSDPNETDVNVHWIRDTWTAMQPFAKDSVYINYVDAGDDARTESAYGGNYARLATIKAKYDPDNVFRHNQNIAPAVSI